MIRRFLGVFLFGILLSGCVPETNLPPIPVVLMEPVRGEAPLFVHGRAQGSWDPDGSVRAVRWNFGNGAEQEGWEVVHRSDQEGDFPVTVEVVDDQGLSTQVGIPVNVGVSYPLDVLEWNVEKYYAGTRVYGGVKNIGERRINLGRVAVRFYDGTGISWKSGPRYWVISFPKWNKFLRCAVAMFPSRSPIARSTPKLSIPTRDEC